MYAHDPGTGFTIWLTGMPLAGKRAVARALVERLRRLERPVELLDGPEWAMFLGENPGSNPEARKAICRRAGFLARMVTRAGGFAIVPLISPHRETRDGLRREIGRFLEVYVDCSFETLMKRDTKGEYAAAMRGDIPDFIGITEPYEPPERPEVRLTTDRNSPDENATRILEALVREGALPPGDIGLSAAPPKESRKPGGKVPEPILFTAEMLRMPAAEEELDRPVPVINRRPEPVRPEHVKAPEPVKTPEKKRPEPVKAPEKKKPEPVKTPEKKKPEPVKTPEKKKAEPVKTAEKKQAVRAPETKKKAQPTKAPEPKKKVEAKKKPAAKK